ncbi:MAG: tRNA (N6-isopentenyl adenosine(37)-C2)-methylthiotransferase MiaB [Clostridia bacterium]|nr:tRNA (N6-isopentenyl adenosine(37)-C2)-methylthiotransferase MiaB [Clostridia bacterium]
MSAERLKYTELQNALAAEEAVHQRLAAVPGAHYAFVDTYGCQQNEADSEFIRACALRMGYTLTEDPMQAELIVVNTCAVRDHAERRVLGNVGAMSRAKREHPDLIIVVAGCMASRPEVQQRLKKSFPYVRVVMSTNNLHRLAEDVWQAMATGKRVFDTDNSCDRVVEALPRDRDRSLRAWVPIMYGCNNFCTYCIVPYVRGRERSRLPEDVIREAEERIAAGAKEIVLLGQNVNSYGKDLETGYDFSDLLSAIAELPGDFRLRFVTSHPKDASRRLIDTMAKYDKISPALHLPFQSGSDRVLKAMNRGYTAAEYLDIIAYAREKIPNIVLTADVIVGFPGETEEDFEKTYELVRKVGFESLFTFIFSPREGTRAAEMEDPIPAAEKSRWFDRLLKLQGEISCRLHEEQVGKSFDVLVEGPYEGRQGGCAARTPGNRLVLLPAGLTAGETLRVRITGATMSALIGEPIPREE